MTPAEKLKTLTEHLEKVIAEHSGSHPDIAEKLEKILFDVTQETKSTGYDKSNLLIEEDGTAKCIILNKMIGEFWVKHKDLYPVDMIKDFQAYWSTPNERGIPAWFSEKSKPRGRFQIAGRLRTWASKPWNKHNSDYKKQKEQPKNEAHRIEIL